MTLPTIHLNGTGRQTLLDGYENARTAVRDALDVLRAVEFNPRDYYVQGDTAWTAARDERETMQRELHRIQTELETILIHVADS